ncbi:hypothetical protein [Sphingomonas sp. MMS24-J13]|uniref:hypothetical protein n=1 Tax=Sphingomonas sp. MMS24-J13 TaxID=3238686 RepID=UPI00384CE887
MEGLEIAIVPSSQLERDLRFDAQFFYKRYLAEDQALHRLPLKKIGEIAFVTDGPHGYHVVDETSAIAMLTASCASNWFADRSGADTIAKWVDDANRRSSLEVEDLILSTRGTVGNCAIVTEEVLPANLDQDVARIAIDTREGLEPSFVLAYLNGKFGQDYITRHASGMVQQGLPLDKVRKIPVPALGEAIQKGVVRAVERAYEMRRTSSEAAARAEDILVVALGLADWAPPEPLAYSAKASDAFVAGRLDAQYFMPAKKRVMQALATLPGKPMVERFTSVREQWVPDRAPATMRVRNYDVTDALLPLLDAEKKPSFAADIGSMKKLLRDGDVAVSRLRSYLKEIAVVRTGDKIPSVGSSEFIVLRPNGADISPETLMVFLRSMPVQTILKWCQDGSQHPRFSESDLLSIPIPDAVAGVSIEVTSIVQTSFAARDKARRLLDATKRAVEIAVEDSEAAALAYLNGVGNS